MRNCARSLVLGAAWLCCAGAFAADALAPALRASLLATGLPLKSFGVYVRAVDAAAPAPMAALNAEQPFVLASTTKVVTSLAALDLLGARHRWETHAFAAAPSRDGRLDGDLRIVGGHAALSRDELRRWFRQMRAQGLKEVRGNIVLEHVALLPEQDPTPPGATLMAQGGDLPAPRRHRVDLSRLVVTAEPAGGERASVALNPRPAGVRLVNEVFMRGGCDAWAQWRDATADEPAQVWVRGRWDASCGRREVAFLRPPPIVQAEAEADVLPPARPARRPPAPVVTAPRAIAGLWAETGGRLRGRVIERATPTAAATPAAPWSTHFSTPLPELLRDINKTSDNVAARSLLLSLAPGASLRAAQDRVHEWLRRRGLADGDIHIDQGSGQSRDERGKPRAMVQLLTWAWKTRDASAFVDSLPIAGVDGTLANRMQGGIAGGHAYLKTGTLGDTRALAGYVRGISGKTYAVAVIVNHPQAARATPALDGVIEWVAKHG